MEMLEFIQVSSRLYVWAAHVNLTRTIPIAIHTSILMTATKAMIPMAGNGTFLTPGIRPWEDSIFFMKSIFISVAPGSYLDPCVPDPTNVVEFSCSVVSILMYICVWCHQRQFLVPTSSQLRGRLLEEPPEQQNNTTTQKISDEGSNTKLPRATGKFTDARWP